jgi:hypothetical protein
MSEAQKLLHEHPLRQLLEAGDGAEAEPAQPVPIAGIVENRLRISSSAWVASQRPTPRGHRHLLHKLGRPERLGLRAACASRMCRSAQASMAATGLNWSRMTTFFTASIRLMSAACWSSRTQSLNRRAANRHELASALKLGFGIAAWVMSPAPWRVSSSRRVSWSHSPPGATGIFLVGPPVTLCRVRGG